MIRKTPWLCTIAPEQRYKHYLSLRGSYAGTAGLRALDGPGWNRMNVITVKQTTQGLVRYLQQQQAAGWDLRCGEDSPNLLSGTDYLRNGIVVGYDGRKNSLEYVSATPHLFCRLLY
jgi:phosphomannomutase